MAKYVQGKVNYVLKPVTVKRHGKTVTKYKKVKVKTKTYQKSPKNVSNEQLINTLTSDDAKLQAIRQNIKETGKSTRAAIYSTAANTAQFSGSAFANEMIRTSKAPTATKSSNGLSQLIDGGLSTTGNSRDEDADDDYASE